MPALPKEEVERLIRQTAAEMGAGDLANVLVATAIAENGLSNTNPGDMGKDGRYHSFGPFHENDGGRGAGLTREQMEDVPAATRRAVAEFRAIQKKNPGVDMGTLAYLSQRPHESVRDSYIKRVNGLAGGMGGASPATAPAPSTRVGSSGLPAATIISGGGARPAGLPTAQIISTSGAGTTGTTAVTAGGSGWPLPGGKVSNKFGGTQARAPGMKGTLPSSNVGVDVAGVPEGSPVVSPVGGQVVKVYQSAGGRNPDENGGYGGMVLVKGNDGYFHRLSHLQGGSVGVKAGDQVKAGQQVAKVGSTGNTLSSDGGPFVHVDWEKFQTKSGNPDDRNTMTFSDPTRGGTAVGNSAGAGGQTSTSGRGLSPEELAEIRAQAQQLAESDAQVAERARVVKELEDKINGRQTTDENGNPVGQDGLRAEQAKAQARVDEIRKKYGGPPDPANNNHKTRVKGSGVIVGGENAPWNREPNPDFAKDLQDYTKADSTVASFRDTTKGKGKELADAVNDLQTATNQLNTAKSTIVAQETSRLTREREEAKKTGAENAKPTYQIDSESGTVLENGVPITTLPRDTKPGTTFSVEGKGVYLLKNDGSIEKLVDALPPGKKVRTVETRTPSGDYVTQLIDDETGNVIATYPRDIPAGDRPSAITAPKDTQYIVQSDPRTGQLTVKDNPNWDPKTRDVTGVSGTGKVYRVDPDGKATITDVLTADERALYEKGKTADVGKTEAETEGIGATTDRTKVGAWADFIKGVKELHDMELEKRKAGTWAEIQKALADPNTSSDQVLSIIQRGAKDATEWSTVFQTFLNQKTQEEVARSNRVKEGIDIQNADRQLREGLYRDINETRNQRQLAQGRANDAIGNNILGLANSANVLSAMIPQVGKEGAEKIGQQGLGVGAMAIRPVQRTWDEHEAELQRLRDQMPSVRLANPNPQSPSFAMPKVNAPGVSAATNKPSGIDWDAINKKQLELLNRVGSSTGVGSTPQTGQGTVTSGIVASGDKIGTPMGGSGISVETGKSVDEMVEEERRKREEGGGGGYARFRVPRGSRR